jgi:CBS domain-containing protein
MTATVGEVMAHELVTCDVNATLTEVAALMRDRDIGDVLVLDGDELRGIVTDRDIVVRGVAAGADPRQATVAGACSEDLLTVSPQTSVDEAARLMAEQAVRRVPVVDGGQPVGVVSLGDLAIEREPTSSLADISATAPND